MDMWWHHDRIHALRRNVFWSVRRRCRMGRAAQVAGSSMGGNCAPFQST